MHKTLPGFLAPRLSARVAACVAAASVALGAASVLGPGPAAHAEEAGPQAKVCPATVVIAARGSEQSQIAPRRYSPEADWTSNGWESQTISDFLTYAEAHYAQAHQGESLLKDTQVIGIEEQSYPGLLYTPRALWMLRNGQSVDILNLVRALSVMTPQQLLGSQEDSFQWSVSEGIKGTAAAISTYEAQSGCRPKYIQIGYSQGAVITNVQEDSLMKRGVLTGSVYIGDPVVKPGAKELVGGAPGGGGMMWQQAPAGVRADAAKVELCFPGDIVCETTPGTASKVPTHLDYYKHAQPQTAGEVFAAEKFAEWVLANRGAAAADGETTLATGAAPAAAPA